MIALRSVLFCFFLVFLVFGGRGRGGGGGEGLVVGGWGWGFGGRAVNTCQFCFRITTLISHTAPVPVYNDTLVVSGEE